MRLRLGATGRLRLGLAAVAWLPLLATDPGRTSADTKVYLTLDPSRLLSRAVWMWDPHLGLGTVTHQNLGYLFPMGPFFWVADRLAVPDWVTQRLWLGAIVFAAGCGVLFCRKALGLPARGAAVAAFAYALSPYLLSYVARLSVILLPFAALPWLLGATVLAVRRGGWRWPAVVALVVGLVGAVNATALVLAGLGPVLWVVHAVVAREVPWRRALAATARIGALAAAVSAWWIAGLWVQGRYGLPILRYTENYEAVARTSSASEVLRGLGYWFFYGGDRLDRWVGPAPPYTTSVPLVVLSLALPAAALAGTWALGACRRFVALLLVVGLAVCVGGHPWDDPSPWGALFKAGSESTWGMALRSTTRAVPLVALALALGLGAGVTAASDALAARRGRRAGLAVPVAATLLIAANLPSWFTGSVLTPSLLRDAVPTAWTQAGAALDAGDPTRRVWEAPGIDFAYYRWGGTVDPVMPGLTDRAWVARELVPWGSPEAADLVGALDRRIQDGTPDPRALAPVLRLLGVGDVVARSDLQFERFGTPRPEAVDAVLDAAGLPVTATFGPREANVPRLPVLDGTALTTPPGPPPAPVELRAVPGSRPVVRAEPVEAPVVLAGDAEGIVDAAAAGLVDGTSTVLQSAALVDHPEVLREALASGATVVVTDTNRRQSRRWSSIGSFLGATEQAGEEPLVRDPTDNRLDTFPGSGDEARTVAELDGVRSVRATGYGTPIRRTPEDRPVNAVDGDPSTAWRVGAFEYPVGQRLEIALDAPLTTDHVTLLQPQDGDRNRVITRARIRLDGGRAIDVDLDGSSLTPPGQRVALPATPFSTLSIEILATDPGRLPGYGGMSGVGFAEVGLDGVTAREVIRLPRDLPTALGADGAGTAGSGNPLAVVLTRWRADAADTTRRDPEPSLARRLDLPAERSLTVTGEARISPDAPDALVAALIGAGAAGGTTAEASARLRSDPASWGTAAVDGDPATAWTTPFGAPGQTLAVRTQAPAAFDAVTLSVVADGRHSVPTRIRVGAGGETVDADVPPVADGPPGTRVDVRVPLPRPLTGRDLTVSVLDVRPVTVLDAASLKPTQAPVALAEIGLAGVPPVTVPTSFDTGCRQDLLRVDGQPVAVRISGSVADALARRPVRVEGCGPALALGAGTHELDTTPGRTSGLDLDRLVLRSPATGGAVAPPAPAPTIEVREDGPTSMTLQVSGAQPGTPFWLVLGQSRNDGWTAEADGRGDLGRPLLVDGYAGGWQVDPPAASFTVHLTWTPQRVVWIGLAVSAAGLAVALVLAGRGGRGAPLPPEPPAPRRARPVGVAVAAAVAGLYVAGGPVAALAGAATAAVLAWAPARVARLLPAVPAGLLGLAAAATAVKMLRYDLPTDLEWPNQVPAAHWLAWAAVAVTAAAAWLSPRLAARSGRRGGPPR